MNLKDAVGEMRVLSQPTEPQVMSLLGDGYHIVLADMSKRGDVMLKYDLHVRDGVFYACKMSDSTRDNIVLTPENAALFDGEFPHITYENYISQRDLIFVDEAGLMHEADMRMGQFSHEAIKSQLEEHGEGVMAFNDIYSPFEGVDVPETNIYIIDMGIPGTMDVLKETISNVRGAHHVTDPELADFSIIPMPAQVDPGTEKFFTGHKFDPSEIRSSFEMVTLLGGNSKKAKGILPYTLLFWTGNAAKLVEKSKSEARLKAATELADAIREYHKDKVK
jgi:hypothetical protein